VERDGYLGGATVNQLMPHILSTNGVDFQGVWHDWIRALNQRRPGAAVPMVGKAGSYFFRSGVDPEVVKYAWDDMLSAVGVTFLHHALVSSAIVQDGVVGGVVVETRSGRRAIMASRIVDCTGDAAVCAQAGVDWEQGHDGLKWNQALTMVFRLGNVDWPEEGFSNDEISRYREIAQNGGENGEWDSPVVINGRAIGYAAAAVVKNHSIANYRTEMSTVASRILKVDPLDPWDLTRAEREGRQQAWQCAEFICKTMRGFENSYLQDTAPNVGVRDSRRVKGIATVTSDDAWSFRKRPDGIARSSWDIDIWPGDSYDRPAVPRDNEDYKKRMRSLGEQGEYFHIPYGALVAAGVDNLLVAGRCLSAERHAEASLRIQQTCQATGEAAGLAAAVSLDRNVTPRELAPSLVVDLLEKRRDIEPAFAELKRIPIA
jgi:hypothetical protein